MKIEIRNRYTNEIIIEGEADSLRDFLEKNSEADLSEADLSEANLYKANLYKANLYKANLSEANLYKANFSEAKIKITQKDEIIKALRIEIVD